MRIIVNADDFGKSESVNQAICECFKKGIITSTTLMVTMPYAEEAVLIAKEQGFLKQIGLHLNLTEGMPMTENIKAFSDICDADGNFNAAFHLNTKSRLFMNRQRIAAIREESAAQLERFLFLCGTDSIQLDSHHHVHTNLPILKAISPLIDKYHVKVIRISRNMVMQASLFYRLYKFMYNKALKKLKVQTTNYFGSFKDFKMFFIEQQRNIEGTFEDKEILMQRENINNKDNKGYKTIEIMLHPMYNQQGQLIDSQLPMENVTAVFDEIRRKRT